MVPSCGCGEAKARRRDNSMGPSAWRCSRPVRYVSATLGTIVCKYLTSMARLAASGAAKAMCRAYFVVLVVSPCRHLARCWSATQRECPCLRPMGRFCAACTLPVAIDARRARAFVPSGMAVMPAGDVVVTCCYFDFDHVIFIEPAGV